MMTNETSGQIEAAACIAPFTVDTSRGRADGRVSSEWFTRPDDERYLNLDDLYGAVHARKASATAQVIETRTLRVEADCDEPERLALRIGDDAETMAPTHWSFGQLCSLIGAPGGYLRSLPAPIAGIALQYGLVHHRSEMVKLLNGGSDTTQLRAITGPHYGRIWDEELVSAVRTIAGDGIGQTRWKVPGQIDWSTSTYNPYVDVTKETTTLYASDRDVFLFLVDDTNPIEAGRLSNGEPDTFFRGFYAWNSEVGSKTLGIASFYLRGVCQNRNIFGMEEFQELKIRHSKFAGSRFAYEASPALERFARSSPASFITGVKNARETIVARRDEDRARFLKAMGFGKSETAKIIETVLREEGRPPESVFDFVQGITAMARTKGNQDARIDLEQKAGMLMARVA